MQFGTILIEDRPELVVRVDEVHLVVLRDAYRACAMEGAPATFQALVEAGPDELRRVSEVLASLASAGDSLSARVSLLAIDTADWLPPQRQPTKILGVAFNNVGIRKAAHVDPGVPNFLLKAPSSLIGHGKSVIVKRRYGHTMPEPELCVILGRRARNIDETAALDVVFGYSVADDVTSHGMKFGMDSIATTREPDLLLPEHLSWRRLHGPDDRDVYFVYHARSKSTDTFGPMGPWVTTADEIPDPNTLRVDGYVDGEQFSSDTTASYTYSVQQLVAEASRYFTLEPGDIINCGTSARGTGNYPRAHRNINFQERECQIEIEIEGLGRLSHRVLHG